MRTLVIGGHGMLGSALVAGWPLGDLLLPTRDELDLAAAEAPERVRSMRPDAILLLAAEHRVDAIEDDPRLAFLTNSVGAGRMAVLAAQIGAPIVFISTDYVFGMSHRSPIPVDARIAPVNSYGISKAAGEMAVRTYQPQHLIVRTSGLFGGTASRTPRPNFVRTILRLASERRLIRVVDDQVCSPTYTNDLAPLVARLLADQAWGTHHVVNAGETSWYDFARLILRSARVDATIAPVSTAEFGARAARPAYSALDTSGLRELGIPELPSHRTALDHYIRSL